MNGFIVSFDGLVASGLGTSQELEVEAAEASADDAFSSSMGVVGIGNAVGGSGHFESGVGGSVRREGMRRG